MASWLVGSQNKWRKKISFASVFSHRSHCYRTLFFGKKGMDSSLCALKHNISLEISIGFDRCSLGRMMPDKVSTMKTIWSPLFPSCPLWFSRKHSIVVTESPIHISPGALLSLVLWQHLFSWCLRHLTLWNHWKLLYVTTLWFLFCVTMKLFPN